MHKAPPRDVIQNRPSCPSPLVRVVPGNKLICFLITTLPIRVVRLLPHYTLGRRNGRSIIYTCCVFVSAHIFAQRRTSPLVGPRHSALRLFSPRLRTWVFDVIRPKGPLGRLISKPPNTLANANLVHSGPYSFVRPGNDWWCRTSVGGHLGH